MSNFELIVTLASGVLAERVAFRWAKCDLVPFVRWLQGNNLRDNSPLANYMKYLRSHGL